MNFLDVFIVIGLAWGACVGFKKGFIIELFTFLALFFGLYAAIHFTDFTVGLIQDKTASESSNLPAIAFGLTFLAVGAMVYFGGKALEKVVKVVQLSLLNKLLGVVFGILKTLFMIGSLILIFESFDEKKDFIANETKEASLLYLPAKSVISFVIPAFKESTLFIKEALNDEELLSAE